MAVYIESTISKLEKNWKHARNNIFVVTEHAKFQRLALIEADMQTNETKCSE